MPFNEFYMLGIKYIMGTNLKHKLKILLQYCKHFTGGMQPLKTVNFVFCISKVRTIESQFINVRKGCQFNVLHVLASLYDVRVTLV